MRHAARNVLRRVPTVMWGGGTLRGLAGAALLSCTAVMALDVLAAGSAQADAALSREAIMKQHQALAQHRGEDGGAGETASDGQDEVASDPVSLAPPVGTSSSPSGAGGQAASSPSHGGGDLVASLLERVSALEGQVRDMHGQLEQLSNQQHQDEATVTKQLGDMQFALESGHHSAHSAAVARSETAGTAAAGAQDAPATAPKTGAEALQAGRAALKARHYDEAEADARAAIRQNKGNWSKTEAQFLLAQSLAGQKAYKNAALTYYDIYSRTPASPRAPESLLGVSASMLALGNKPAACEALQRLGKEYPKAGARVKASEKIFRERAGCH